MQIVTVAGIRPDFIRLSETIMKLDKADCEHTLIHTGQHFDNNLSGVFFEELEIRQPDYNLGCGGGDHIDQLTKLVPAMRGLLAKLVDKREPHLIVFLGDSNSVLMAPFLKKEGYSVAHIEALMRSHDMRMLEETNRICCDSVSDLLLSYHSDYLTYGNKLFGKKVVVGNTILEPTLKHMPTVAHKNSHILVDIHRPENFMYPDRMHKIIDLCKKVKEYEQCPVYFLEFPRTLSRLKKYDISLDGLDTIPLMGYKEHLSTQYHSRYIISDSGTDQEQPALLGVPVLVPRKFTERPQSYKYHCSSRLSLSAADVFLMREHALYMMRNMNSLWIRHPEDGVNTSDAICEALLNFR